MVQIEEIYARMTGVDIEEQRKQWDERGKGYYGEFLVFCELYKNIPGACKILMNLEFPASFGRTTEIDLLMIHETGLYVFEVKHFKGKIYGQVDEERWTQYFRTSSNKVFKNPVKQNQYHIENVKRQYPGIPVYSFVVFTGDECELNIRGEAADTSICDYYGLIRQVNGVFAGRSQVLTLSQIDSLFNEMKTFSHMVNETVQVADRDVLFYEYVEMLTGNFKSSLEQNKLSYENKIKRAQKKLAVIGLVVVGVVVIGCMGWVVNAERMAQKAQEQMEAFAQKFEYVGEFHNGDIKVKKDMVLVSNVVLEDSADFEDTVNFSCTLAWNGGNYYVTIGKDAKIVVFLSDGSVQEYDFWNSTNKFTTIYKLGIGNWYNFKTIDSFELYGVGISDVAYIKLVNLGLRSLNEHSSKDLVSGFEIELYSKDDG